MKALSFALLGIALSSSAAFAESPVCAEKTAQFAKDFDTEIAPKYAERFQVAAPKLGIFNEFVSTINLDADLLQGFYSTLTGRRLWDEAVLSIAARLQEIGVAIRDKNEWAACGANGHWDNHRMLDTPIVDRAVPLPFAGARVEVGVFSQVHCSSKWLSFIDVDAEKGQWVGLDAWVSEESIEFELTVQQKDPGVASGTLSIGSKTIRMTGDKPGNFQLEPVTLHDLGVWSPDERSAYIDWQRSRIGCEPLSH